MILLILVSVCVCTCRLLSKKKLKQYKFGAELNLGFLVVAIPWVIITVIAYESNHIVFLENMSVAAVA